MEIVSDRPEVAACLRRIEGTILKNGGFTSPDARIVCRNNQMWVEMEKISDPQSPVFVTPENCLPPVTNVEFRLSGDSFEIMAVPDIYTPAQRSLLEDMIAIYNLCGKAALWRQSNPGLALAEHPEIRRHLYSGRTPNIATIAKFNPTTKEGIDKLIINSFLSSRTLQAGKEQSGGRHHYLMPIIDIFNHDISGAAYDLRDSVLQIKPSQPVGRTKEIFAQYTILDALDCLSAYGFTDDNAAMMRSVPVTIKFEQFGILEINSQIVRPRKEKLPAALADLKMFFPVVRRTENRKLSASHLFIPSTGAPRSLRRILTILIRNMEGVDRSRPVEQLVLFAEEQVITANLNYLARLEALLDSVVPSAQEYACFAEIRRMTQKQKSMIEQYLNIARS